MPANEAEQLLEAVQLSWAIDTEDGMFCQYCGAEIAFENPDCTAEDVVKKTAPYTCEHIPACVATITAVSRTAHRVFELTVHERRTWGRCPRCMVQHGEPCRLADGSFHIERLRFAPTMVRIEPLRKEEP